MTTESKVFGALVLFVGAIVVAAVALDIYLHPPDPEPVGTALIEVSGTEGVEFRGTLGTVREEHAIEGRTPLTFTTPYRRADYVTATIEPVQEGGQGTLRVAIKKVRRKAEDQTVETGKTEATGGRVFLVWKPPREGH